MLLTLVAVAVLAAPSAAAAKQRNLVETAASEPHFSTLVKLVKKAGLAKTLSGKANFTVFAPTNRAFAKVPKKTLNALAKDKAKLQAVLLYHVVKGKVPARKVVKRTTIKTVNGARVKVKV